MIRFARVGSSTPSTTSWDHQIADPVEELHDPLLGVLQADLARFQPPDSSLTIPLGARYKFMTLHGLPAFCSDLLGQVGLFLLWSQWLPVSAFPPLSSLELTRSPVAAIVDQSLPINGHPIG